MQRRSVVCVTEKICVTYLGHPNERWYSEKAVPVQYTNTHRNHQCAHLRWLFDFHRRLHWPKFWTRHWHYCPVYIRWKEPAEVLAALCCSSIWSSPRCLFHNRKWRLCLLSVTRLSVSSLVLRHQLFLHNLKFNVESTKSVQPLPRRLMIQRNVLRLVFYLCDDHSLQLVSLCLSTHLCHSIV